MVKRVVTVSGLSTFNQNDRDNLLQVKSDLALQIAITQGIIERLDKLESRVSIIDEIGVLKATVTNNSQMSKDFETRLRILEGWRWFTLGMAAVISYIIAHLPK